MSYGKRFVFFFLKINSITNAYFFARAHYFSTCNHHRCPNSAIHNPRYPHYSCRCSHYYCPRTTTEWRYSSFCSPRRPDLRRWVLRCWCHSWSHSSRLWSEQDLEWHLRSVWSLRAGLWFGFGALRSWFWRACADERVARHWCSRFRHFRHSQSSRRPNRPGHRPHSHCRSRSCIWLSCPLLRVCIRSLRLNSSVFSQHSRWPPYWSRFALIFWTQPVKAYMFVMIKYGTL